MASPLDLARAYDTHLLATWSGRVSAAWPFALWLARHWVTNGPSEPEAMPDAVSLVGFAGPSVRWYAGGDTVLGFMTGRPHGCYLIPVGEAPPPVFGDGDPEPPRREIHRQAAHAAGKDRL